jgi:hypothetical protein
MTVANEPEQTPKQGRREKFRASSLTSGSLSAAHVEPHPSEVAANASFSELAALAALEPLVSRPGRGGKISWKKNRLGFDGPMQRGWAQSQSLGPSNFRAQKA